MVKHFCDICKKEAITELISFPVLEQKGLNRFNEPNLEVTRQQFDICKNCLKEIAKEFTERTGRKASGDE